MKTRVALMLTTVLLSIPSLLAETKREIKARYETKTFFLRSGRPGRRLASREPPAQLVCGSTERRHDTKSGDDDGSRLGPGGRQRCLRTTAALFPAKAEEVESATCTG